MNSQYKIIFDNVKPYEEKANGDEELKAKLKKFYIENGDGEYSQSDAFIYVYSDIERDYDDITESQFIKEMINEIIQEVEFEELSSKQQRRELQYG